LAGNSVAVPSRVTSHLITPGPASAVVSVPPQADAPTIASAINGPISNVVWRSGTAACGRASGVPIRAMHQPSARPRTELGLPSTRRSGRCCATLVGIAQTQSLQRSSVVRCDWCGLANDSGNHASLDQCVEALQREVHALRGELAKATGAPAPDPPPRNDGRLPWKFRNT